MRRRLFLLAPAVLTPLLLLLLGVVHVPTASASAACSLQTCNGQDPHATGCDAAVDILATVTDGGSGASVRLDYTPLCNAFWARSTITGDVPSNVQIRTALETRSAVPGSPVFGESYYGGPQWTPMEDSARLARACVQLTAPSTGTYTCTAWFLPRITYGGVGSTLEIPQGAPSALDTTCPYGERYWAAGVSTTGTWGVTWYVSGLLPWGWYRISADVRCDGTATSALYDVDDPSGGRHWFQINQLAYDWAPLGSGTWQADGNGTVTVRLSNGKNPNGQVVAAGLNLSPQNGGIHCPCPV